MNAGDKANIRKFWGNGSPQTRVMARDENNNPTYIAVASRGHLTSDPAWEVEKLVYDGNGFYSYSQHSPELSIADNYTSLTYS